LNANRIFSSGVAAADNHKGEPMKDAQTYRQYAADCRRIAETMSGEDKATLLRMAEVWEMSAREAERQQARNKDAGNGANDGPTL